MLVLPTLSTLALALMPADGDRPEGAWPHWRGPVHTGEAPSGNPPIEFGEDRNLRWKVEIPGKGKASPIVYGDRVYVLTARGTGEMVEVPEPEESGDRGGRRGRRGRRSGISPTEIQEFVVLALDREDGSVVWESVANRKLPGEGTHGDGSWASGSAVTDGEVLLAHFGSQGLFAYSLDGEKQWEKQLGQMRTRNGFGEGSSPAIHEDYVVVQWDHEGDSFIVALDRNTGEERWRRERDEVTSWATPLIVEVDGRMQVIANATSRIRGYDLETGEDVWECGGMTTNAIPTPIHRDGVVYVMSGFRGSALVAIALEGAEGDITGSEHVLWSFGKDTPYVPSGVLHDGLLYFVKGNNGVLSIFDVDDGERVFGPERLETIENVYASPVAVNGRIYLAGRDGGVEVLKHGPTYELLAKTRLEEGFDASPAIAGDELYLRGAQHLYCFAAEGRDV